MWWHWQKKNNKLKKGVKLVGCVANTKESAIEYKTGL
jgi:hypothetical protein